MLISTWNILHLIKETYFHNNKSEMQGIDSKKYFLNCKKKLYSKLQFINVKYELTTAIKNGIEIE